MSNDIGRGIDVSVIVLTYNSEKFVEHALDSILDQKTKYTFEIIIGDDCSVDGTRRILSSYCDGFPEKIRVIYNDNNMGVVLNYFNVVKTCRGKYVMLCAGDDYWLEGKIEKQVDYMENNHKVGMCCSGVMYLDQTTNTLLKNKKKAGVISFEDLIYANRIAAPTVCMRCELLYKYVNDIDPINKGWYMEDYPTWLWFAKHSVIVQMEDYLSVYRVLGESYGHPKNIDKCMAFIDSVKDVKTFFADSDELKEHGMLGLYSQLSRAYLKHGDIQNYRRYVIKTRKYRAIKWLLSFFPLYPFIMNRYYIRH